jgi:hypothetical protein
MDAGEWDGTRIVVDHIDVHAPDYGASVRFYETVLAPLGIPRIGANDEGTCFTNVNVLDRAPVTTNQPGYYAAYLLDPDDNNVEALYRDVGCAGESATGEAAPGSKPLVLPVLYCG